MKPITHPKAIWDVLTSVCFVKPFKNSRLRQAALVLLAFVFLSLKTSAQSTPQWILDTTISNVKCYHMLASCNGQDVVMLKFENERQVTAIVTWSSKYITSNPQPQSHPSGTQSIYLQPGTTAAAGCAETNTTLITKASELGQSGSAVITGFSFASLSVE